MLNDITNKNFRAIPNKSVEDMPNKKLLNFKQKLRNIPSKFLAILKKLHFERKFRDIYNFRNIPNKSSLSNLEIYKKKHCW